MVRVPPAAFYGATFWASAGSSSRKQKQARLSMPHPSLPQREEAPFVPTEVVERRFFARVVFIVVSFRHLIAWIRTLREDG
jgi:hypothetical protein